MGSFIPIDVRDWTRIFLPTRHRVNSSEASRNLTGGLEPRGCSARMNNGYGPHRNRDLWKTYVMGEEEIHA